MTHLSNLATIHGAVFEGPYAGCMKSAPAAEWLARYARYAHDAKASVAIRKARNGVAGASFRAVDGVVWHLTAEGR